MEVNCLSCGHRINIGDAYDDFEGQIRCFVCGELLQIKTEAGKIKAVSMVSSRRPARPHKMETQGEP